MRAPFGARFHFLIKYIFNYKYFELSYINA